MDLNQEVLNTLNKLSDNLGASTTLITNLTEDRKKTLENVLTKLTTLQSEVQMVAETLNLVNTLCSSLVETLVKKGLVSAEELQSTAMELVQKHQERVKEISQESPAQ